MGTQTSELLAGKVPLTWENPDMPQIMARFDNLIKRLDAKEEEVAELR